MFFAGSIGSGKSSVARSVADLLGAGYASFGDEVRERAAKQGHDPKERTILQTMGEDLVANHLPEFANAVIRRLTPRDESMQYLVFDGLRHLTIYEFINWQLPGRSAIIVFLDASADMRHARGISRGVSIEASRLADAHASESQLSTLQKLANLRLRGDSSIDSNAELVVDYLRNINSLEFDS